MWRTARGGGIALAVTAIVAATLWVVDVPAAQAAVVPAAHEDAYGLAEGEPVSVPAPGVLGNDFGIGPGYQATRVDGGTIWDSATLTVHADGSFDFDPGMEGSGENSFFYCISPTGSDTCVSDPAVVYLFIGQSFIASHEYAVSEGETLTEAAPGLLAGSANRRPDDEVYVRVPATHGSFTAGDDGAFTYVPESGFIGTDKVGVCFTTAAPECTGNTATVSITVYPQPPDQAFDTVENVPYTNNLMTAIPYDGFIGTLLAAAPANGTIVLNFDGSFTYTSNQDFAGADAFQYCLSTDGINCLSDDPGTVRLTVAAVSTETTTTLQATPNPVSWGENVTLTATVSGDGASGTVAFSTGGTTLSGCAAIPLAAGTAECITDRLEVGSPTVTATYSGDASFDGSNGTTTVTVARRTVDISYTGPATGAVGQALTLSGTATDALSADPVGGLAMELTFQDWTCNTTTTIAGVARCSVEPQQAGTSDATISFAGNVHYAAASESSSVAIGRANTATTNRVEVTDADFTEPVTMTATVRSISPGTPSFAGGTVAFDDGGRPIAGCGAVPVVAADGTWTATCVTTDLPVGGRTLQAIFSGTDNYHASAGSTVMTVHPAPTSLAYTGATSGTVTGSLPVSAVLTNTVGADPLPVAGQPIDFGWGEQTCTGVTGDDGAASCVLPITGISQAGELTATYAGSTNYAGTAVTADIAVDPVATDTSVTAPASAVFGTEVTLDAVIAPSDGDGTVDFTVADAPIAGCESVTPSEVDGSWTASCVTSTLPIGDNSIAAVFSGTADYQSSFGTTTVNIEAAPTALSYTGPTGGTVGAPLAVSAVLTATATEATIAGQSVDVSWGELACTATTGDDGTATCELPITAVAQAGELTVSYAGSNEYTGSSATADISVDPAATSLDYLGDTDGTAGTPVAVSARINLIEPATAVDQPGDGLHRAGTFQLAAAPVAIELAGLRLQFTLGAARCEGITDASGVASCSLVPTVADEQAQLIITFVGTADLTAAQLAVPLAVAAAPVAPTETAAPTTPSEPTQTAPPAPSTVTPPLTTPTDIAPSATEPTDASTSSTDPVPAVPPSSGGLATTGVDIGGWLTGAVVLLGAGALFLLTARRRRTPGDHQAG